MTDTSKPTRLPDITTREGVTYYICRKCRDEHLLATSALLCEFTHDIIGTLREDR